MPHPKDKKAAPAAARSTAPITEYAALFGAADSFIRNNANFESSVPVEAAIEAVGACVTFQDAFAVPLRRQLFTLDAALRWALFLRVAAARAAEEGDEPFGGPPFDAGAALGLIAQVYDVGVQDAVYDHFEAESESASDESGDDAHGDEAKP